MDTSAHQDKSTASRFASLTPDKARRRVLVLGLGILGTSGVAVAPAVAAPPPQDPSASQGYRESEHVRTYYATTRL